KMLKKRLTIFFLALGLLALLVFSNLKTRTRCSEEEVGEIWICDPSVAVGYWRRPEETQKIFGCRLADAPEEGPFLSTGDLGFIKDGELYFTGRIKDLVIIDGVNHYPQDIEWTVQECYPGLLPGHCVAFSIEEDNTEKLVVMAEIKQPLEDWEPLFSAVRRAVAENHELTLHAFVALKKGGVYKTSSGKVQRRGSCAAYLNGKLDAYAIWKKPVRALKPSEQNKISQTTNQIDRTSQTDLTSGDKKQNTDPKNQHQNIALTSQIRSWLIGALARQLDLPEASIDPNAPFADHGLSSRTGVEMVGELERWLEKQHCFTQELSHTLLWEYPTIDSLSRYLGGLNARPEPVCTLESPADCDNRIAIVSMAFRLPGADNPADFWNLLKERKIAVTELPKGRWKGMHEDLKQGNSQGQISTLRGGFLNSVDKFDAALFGIVPREAQIMDPQQRLLLEVAWETFERAGINMQKLAGSDTGVFVGISTDDYTFFQMGSPDLISAYTGPGKALSISANRISYQFDLQGPSMAIDTACSSSLVAMHQACQSLKRGECSLALAGGVNLILSPHMSIALSQAGMLAPDGLCKTFDASADGYVRGEGCALILLKRLADAQRDNDNILAIIRGSAVNQDGKSNGLTAPNAYAQQQVIANALSVAGVKPSEVSYIETHGTGTSLGDPIEVKSIQSIVGKDRPSDRICALGAVKANIGHLEAAAGIAGVIKTVLSMSKGEIPPHPGMQKLNPLIKLEGTPFIIPTDAHPWPDGPRIAGISSFGFGGTNAHVIIEAPPEVKSAPVLSQSKTQKSAPALPQSKIEKRPTLQNILALSALDDPALRALALSWKDYFKSSDLSIISEREKPSISEREKLSISEKEKPSIISDRMTPASLEDLCYSAAISRASLPQRATFTGKDREEMLSALDEYLSYSESYPADNTESYHDRHSGKNFQAGRALKSTPRVVFFFTGQGSQYPGMGKELYETEPAFRNAMIECDQILAPLLNLSLLDLLYGTEPASTEQLARTALTQPVLFSLEYSLACMWMNMGIKPTAMLGHSVGEYVAACVAKVFSLADGLRLVSERARLVHSAPGDGTMIAVMADDAKLKSVIDRALNSGHADISSSDVVIGCYNGPGNNVLSGSRLALKQIEILLEQEGIETRSLAVSHAFHSPMMEPILDEFNKVASSITYSEPLFPIYSNVTGTVIGKEMAHPDYWVKHLRSPVKFDHAVKSLLKDGVDVCLEVGPKPVLVSMAHHISEE
ncbi:MAG: acyltransferase domain-containing protein, partial [Desulfamplus sp.]|nr:acyltransferase domain-containing protein [Desulfamplus sp.]